MIVYISITVIIDLKDEIVDYMRKEHISHHNSQIMLENQKIVRKNVKWR